MDRRSFIGGLSRGSMAASPPENSAAAGAAPPLPPPMPEQKPLDAQGLETLERGLTGADLSGMIKGQVIRQIGYQEGRSFLLPWGTEYFIDIRRLKDTVAPTTNFFTNPWLFRRLTGTLDRSLLAHAEQLFKTTETQVVSVNINIATMLAGGVHGLAELGATYGKAVIMEVRLEDVVTDPTAFLVARSVAARFGCSVLLDAVNAGLVTRVDRERMGVDFIKLLWSKDLQAALSADKSGERVRAAIASIGPERIILGHVDDAQAIAAGQAMGIGLFQGFHIDAIGEGKVAQ
ncbi:MAG: hypothetical protein ACPGYL_02265 [Rhodospirillaceae bacterium]